MATRESKHVCAVRNNNKFINETYRFLGHGPLGGKIDRVFVIGYLGFLVNSGVNAATRQVFMYGAPIHRSSASIPQSPPLYPHNTILCFRRCCGTLFFSPHGKSKRACYWFVIVIFFRCLIYCWCSSFVGLGEMKQRAKVKSRLTLIRAPEHFVMFLCVCFFVFKSFIGGVTIAYVI